jgi:hypothetical protein
MSTAPENNAQNVTPPSELSAVFDRSLSSGAMESSWMTATVLGQPLPGQLAIDPGNDRRLVLHLDQPPPTGTAVLVTLSPTIQAADGGLLSVGVQWGFFTGAQGDPPGDSRFTVDRLSDLRTGPAGSLELSGLHLADPEAGRIAVTWSSASLFVENRFIEPGGALSEISTVDAFSDGLEVEPDGTGGVVAYTGLQYIAFGPDPEDLVVDLPPVLFVQQLIHSGGARLVASYATPGDPVTADYNPMAHGWAPTSNPGPDAFAMDELVLPYPGGGFQTLTTEPLPGGGQELRATFYALDGQVLGSHGFGPETDGGTYYRPHVRPDGGVLAVFVKTTPSGVDLGALEFDPVLGWSGPTPMGSFNQTVPDGIGNVLAHTADGAAVFCMTSSSNDVGSYVLWRDAGASTWSQLETGSYFFPLACTISSDGELYLASIWTGNRMRLMAKAPGAGSGWTEPIDAAELGVLDELDLIGGQARLCPASGGRIVVVAGVLPGIGSDLSVLRAAYVDLE